MKDETAAAVLRVATFITRWTGLKGGFRHPQNIYGISNGQNTAHLTVDDLQCLIKAVIPRIISTAEELDALKWGSIVRDSEDDAWQRHGNRWNVSGGNPAGENLPTLPATVIWEPTP